MAIGLTLPSFNVLSDPKPEDASLPAFMVSTTRGFLPRTDPIVELPAEFQPLEDILNRMPIKKADGTPGLLAECKLGETVDRELPDLIDAIQKHKGNLPLMNALYRDYSFLASAYLLEPCHERFMRGEPYGLAREKLPRTIAMPIVVVAEIAGFKPWMEYAGSYALFNYRLENPKLGLEYSNMRLIRAFEHGLDPSSSEAGFVLIHVAMVRHSGLLVSGALRVLEGCAAGDRDMFNDGLNQVVDALKKVNHVMNEMWNKSKPGDYTSFRTFIFGIANQTMFPNGVIYEGYNNDEPQFFRGESGANDSMLLHALSLTVADLIPSSIPLSDNLLEVDMPDTPLTAILRDFRSYRPGNHREFLEWVANTAATLHVRDFAVADRASAIAYLRALNQVRDFRWRHWCFTKEYILRHTKHATATGGSPIVTWLPNQLQAVLDQMIQTEKFCAPPSGPVSDEVDAIMQLVRLQSVTLSKDVARYRKEREE